MPRRHLMNESLAIIVPLCRDSEELGVSFQNITALVSEISALAVTSCSVVDGGREALSPELLKQLRSALGAFGVRVDTIRSTRNALIQSMNQCLDQARNESAYVLVIQPEAILEPGSFAEMLDVLRHDEKFAFVAPNVLPAGQGAGELGVLGSILPRWRIVPSVPSGCLMIRNAVIEVAGLLDERLEWMLELAMDDLIMRANGFGFLALFADRAHVTYLGVDQDNSTAVADPTIVSVSRVERLAWVNVSERRRPSLLLDLSFLTYSHNGTSELARAVVAAIAGSEDWNDSFDTTVRAYTSALRYNGLDAVIPRYKVLSPQERPGREYSIWLLMHQPFSWTEMLDIWPVTSMHVFYFLDSIAADCRYLEEGNPGLRELWDFTAQHASAIGFLSRSSMESFYRRFSRSRADYDFVAIPSCNPDEYSYGTARVVHRSKLSRAGTIFVVGNKLAHKRVNPITDLLAVTFPDRTIVALGYQGKPPSGVVPLESGALTDSRMASIYGNAEVVVFPSMYEGFGFPIMRSIGNERPVVCWDSDVTREVLSYLEGSRWASLVYPVGSDSELVETVRSILETCSVEEPVPEGAATLNNSEKFTVENGRWSWADTVTLFKDSLLELACNKDELLRTRDSMREIEHISAANESLRQRVHEIEGSTSWKLTAPARIITDLGRTLLQSFRRPARS
jgi:glycosyltransferase involved in cell wall biosynthesis